ncbi:conserved membrane protein of unknown function [Tenacibaculum sp. 190130A14a]|uniref:DUF1449 family protein n=1 Tax=Tenacibaculum polynesiense TaxID=3137857 RepID=A0ABM9PFG0_9FLAO
MNSLTDILFSSVNITLTLLVIILITYWLITMLTGIDFDLDVDVDIDIDVDTDVDIDTGIEGGNVDFHDISNTEINKEDIVDNKRRKPLKWWQVILIYFNFVGLPFMFTFTSWIFIWWICTAISTTITHSFNNNFGFILMLAGFIPSLFITKIFTTPFKNFFKNLNQDGDKPIDLIGRTGISLSTITENKMGTAEVKAENKNLTINIKPLNNEKINYQDQILIIKESNDNSFYFVQKYIN